MGIFGATSSNSKLFQSGEATAAIGGKNAVLLSVTVTVARQLAPVPTLTNGVWWSAQPVTGTLQAESILTADKDLVSSFADQNKCTPQAITLKLNNSCGSGDVTISIADAFCNQVAFTANGNQGYVGTSLGAQFTTCTIS